MLRSLSCTLYNLQVLVSLINSLEVSVTSRWVRDSSYSTLTGSFGIEVWSPTPSGCEPSGTSSVQEWTFRKISKLRKSLDGLIYVVCPFILAWISSFSGRKFFRSSPCYYIHRFRARFEAEKRSSVLLCSFSKGPFLVLTGKFAYVYSLSVAEELGEKLWCTPLVSITNKSQFLLSFCSSWILVAQHGNLRFTLCHLAFSHWCPQKEYAFQKHVLQIIAVSRGGR